ncbi:MAG: bifunctional folylpolyglutamate synthase/dihydrofolate synthase [Chitinophagaceae bacterium]|nr:MAG: bifunctional folylpolyglutamate synthase/dihydrofolate synthase [Chitinophagaceae bacterium]
MNYQETLAYLYEQLPMFSRLGAAAYKKDLHNTIALCEALNNPQTKFRSIHVAGTNGKGSTSHMLAAILQQAGYKTGLYTSPHIKDFGERIRINGKMIDEQYVIDFVQRTKSLYAEIQPSFFELTVAMAFDYFAQEKIDIAIVETGLGGRLDSTNIIQPILSVITNIGYDHMNLLGNTLPEIAWQKAGIIKPNIPTIIGEAIPETRNVFIKEANEKEAVLHFAQSRYLVEYIDPTGNLLFCNVRDIQNNNIEKLQLDLNGIYQVKNVCTVLCAVEQLRLAGYHITENHLHEALSNVKRLTGMRGRWEVLQQHPSVIADVAHNADGIKQVLFQLQNTAPHADLHLVLGFVKDKDVEHVLELFPANAKFYFTNAHIPRALPHAELKEIASRHNLLGESFDDVNDAITHALKAASQDAVIVVCGSFFIVGEIKLYR